MQQQNIPIGTLVVVDEYGITQPAGPVVLLANENYLFILTLPATQNSGDRSHVYTITVTGSIRPAIRARTPTR